MKSHWQKTDVTSTMYEYICIVCVGYAEIFITVAQRANMGNNTFSHDVLYQRTQTRFWRCIELNGTRFTTLKCKYTRANSQGVDFSFN